MFPNATVSSRSSSSRSGSCGRNSSMPSLQLQTPLSPRTSINPLFRSTENQFTSFDASHFNYQQHKMAEKRKSYLRRYHSHDSQANLGESSGESKNNSPDSTQDRMFSRSISDSASSPESTGDRNHEYQVKDFLERYSLPRVVRVAGGEPLLLYRCFDSFTKVQAIGITGKKGKEKTDSNILHFPEGYLGWFSLLNEKGERCAIAHTSLLHLVREQVCSFLSLSSFTAYTAHSPDPSDAMARVQYLKTVVRGGQVFRLRAVFQHRDRPDAGRHSTRSERVSRSSRDKDLANRYAQLMDVNNQELYAPLTTKGEFYEIYSSTKARLCFPGMLDKTGPLALDKDCLYRLAHLMRRVHLPVKVKLMCGTLPPGLPKDFPDTFILEKKFHEPLLVTCTLPPSSDSTRQHEISCINLNSKLKVSRSMLGFDSEYKLFKSQRLQMALSHCHKNIEQWYRQVRLAANLKQEVKTKVEDGCENCRKNNKVCNHKVFKPCEMNEEIKRYTETNLGKQLITKEVIEKFPKSKKWYRHFIGGGNESSYDKMMKESGKELDGIEKVRSIDRYKDMSKLIEEKFGRKNYNPVKKSASFMFSTKRIDLEETPMKTKGNPSLLKCQSLDTQICISDENDKKFTRDIRYESQIKKRGSDASESLSNDFQMCILDNDTSNVNKTKTSLLKTQGQSLKDLRSLNMVITNIDLDEIKSVDQVKPDLIPSNNFSQSAINLKDNKNENSFITKRLCTEFHVKTKIQKKSTSKTKILASSDNLESNNLKTSKSNDLLHVVQVHSLDVDKVQSRALPVVDDLPYSHVVDEVRQSSTTVRTTTESENIYAEICDNTNSFCKCTNQNRCLCVKSRKGGTSEYCYVKLGSNGESITQSSDDDIEAIYNTLR